jgi:hypothetical protein
MDIRYHLSGIFHGAIATGIWAAFVAIAVAVWGFLKSWDPVVIAMAILGMVGVTLFLINQINQLRRLASVPGPIPTARTVPGTRVTPLTDSWVEEQLRALGFDYQEIHTWLGECADRLNRHGLLSEERATSFFADAESLGRLRGHYRNETVLGRTTTPLDPFGWCAWGPILHRATTMDEKGLADAYVRQAIRKWRESGGDRPPSTLR